MRKQHEPQYTLITKVFVYSSDMLGCVKKKYDQDNSGKNQPILNSAETILRFFANKQNSNSCCWVYQLLP